MIVRTDDGRRLVATKGAAEVILAMSTLDTPGRASWHDEIARLAEGAHKVIAVASREADGLPASGGEPDSGFEFVGLLAFEDPVREGVRDAVRADGESTTRARTATSVDGPRQRQCTVLLRTRCIDGSASFAERSIVGPV